MPAQAVSYRAEAQRRHAPVVLACQPVVLRGGQEIEAPPVPSALGRALEPRHEEGVEKAWYVHSVPPAPRPSQSAGLATAGRSVPAAPDPILAIGAACLSSFMIRA